VIYADPSFLFSLYAWDDNSATAAGTFAKDQRRPIFFTPWQRFELKNAVRLATGRLVRSGQPLLFQPGNVFKAIQEDLNAGRLQHVEPDWREALRLADELSGTHTQAIGTASVDVWHVAAAVLLGAEIFWTFDEIQYSLASKCGRLGRVPKLLTAR
jgi:hypothetical protein